MKRLEKIILGTVQFGLDYGINNSSGKFSKNQVFDILDTAFSSGIRMLDTADAYGNASDLIGAYHRQSENTFDVITKFKSGYSNLENLETYIDQTLEKLSIQSIFGYLYHSFSDYIEHLDVLEQLVLLRDKKKIKHIGVSLYTNDELEQVLENDDIKIIQLPYNLLDNANKRGVILKRAKGKGKIIHTRSVFLQGLFFKDVQHLPEILLPLKKSLIKIQKLASNEAELIASISLNYALSVQNIDGVLIGVDNINQLKQNIEMINRNLSKSIGKEIDRINIEDVSLLNPSNWS